MRAPAGAPRGAGSAASQRAHTDHMTEFAEERDAVGAAYLARLTDADLRTLVHADRASTAEATARIAALRREPALILDVLDRPATSAAILNLAGERAELAFVSPFLVFAAAIHRTAADLATTSYAPERAQPRLRVPVFDAFQLAAYLAMPRHRLFLADLLASFARISSGVAVTRTPEGALRRRRWNDMDPAGLAVLLESVPPAQRPAVWRRLGDLALFLVGVFPDAAERVAADRLAAMRLAERTGLGPHDVPHGGAGELMEWLGAGWYRLAAVRTAQPAAQVASLTALAAEFHPARRVLNTATDRYLLPVPSTWFAPPR